MCRIWGGPMQSMIDAVLANDVERVREAVLDRTLNVSVQFPEQFMLESIAHWIYAGDTVLHLAAAAHRAEIVGVLVDAGADVSARSRRKAEPLHYAADGYPLLEAWDAPAQVDTLRLLLQAGADPDSADANGATPLHRAVRTRCADAVRCLLGAGASAEARNKSGSTPFYLAVQDTGRGGTGTDVARSAPS
ncbi:MAG: hypothetical protein CMQ24_02830 [Gammaproteobacteria bacterium]|nr:hypothetical protein [Gammaproteobacteria bacterium]